MSVFDTFVKKHDYLVCVDSDGCAMDTMNCKHFHCFGPCMVMEWDLEQWRIPILERWNQVNLFQMTRGINRFKGLALALTEIDAQYTPIPGVKTLTQWVETTKALSNDALIAAIGETPEGEGKACLEKALSWSRAVNESIVHLPDELKVPFPGAKEGLEAAHAFADVAIVSSANRGAVEEEWTVHGLLEHTDIMLAQDCGSKAHCIGEMLKFGYEKDHVLMVGDAPGDCDAAESNGVWYFPILVNKEGESWAELKDVALEKLQNGQYGPYQPGKKQEFLTNLGG
ncbi:MAG: HAD hydrolase-like protein [Oscillospiraceae bacterium]|nr:HAD hydrolase-like protein [Oscillospiraceae bacterium]